MKFFTLAVLITSTFALPRSSEKKSLGQMSLEEGQQKCGEHAKLACCNGRVHSGSDNSNGGILGALLGGNNSGRDGIGQYDQCSEVMSDCMSTLPGFSVIMRTEILALLGLNGLLGDKCKQNIACCDASEAKTVCLICRPWYTIANVLHVGWWPGQHLASLCCFAGSSLVNGWKCALVRGFY